MIPPPVALGLTLCDYVIVEERTRKVSCIGSFTGVKVASFPAIPPVFCVFAPLTGGAGEAALELVVTRLDTDQEVYMVRQKVHFPDRLTEVCVLFRIRDCSFPAAGWYEFALLVDSEWIARRRLHAYAAEA
jgi:hypothetical protein